MASRSISLLVTVKAYPAVSQKHGESVCVAGIRTDTPAPEWVRLFPVPFRDLGWNQRFKKYQEITVRATHPAGSDTRPESWRPDPDSLRTGAVFDSARNWRKRKPYVLPLVAESMCEIQRRQVLDGTSLGVFKPAAMEDFVPEADNSEWKPNQQAVVQQPSLLAPTKTGLEKIPYRFRYRYRCSDRDCRGHSQSIIDWELAQSYRDWREKYGEEGVIDKLRQRWLDEMWAAKKDSYLFVGNQHKYPEGFLVLGVFWPNRG
jgi:hypothetical protein